MSDQLMDPDGEGEEVSRAEESVLSQAEVLAQAVRVAASRCGHDLMPAPIYRIGVDD